MNNIKSLVETLFDKWEKRIGIDELNGNIIKTEENISEVVLKQFPDCQIQVIYVACDDYDKNYAASWIENGKLEIEPYSISY